jgi:hypothetical protein
MGTREQLNSKKCPNYKLYNPTNIESTRPPPLHVSVLNATDIRRTRPCWRDTLPRVRDCAGAPSFRNVASFAQCVRYSTRAAMLEHGPPALKITGGTRSHVSPPCFCVCSLACPKGTQLIHPVGAYGHLRADALRPAQRVVEIRAPTGEFYHGDTERRD